jgi:hypothetical protein
MRRWEITFVRVWLVLFPALSGGILVAGPSAPSLWHAAAVGGVLSDASLLLGWLVTPTGRLWLLQIFGLRPAATRGR